MFEVSYRIAQLDDVDTVFEFEMNQRFGDQKNEFENQMSVWTSSFRKESLEHYFKTGWSFISENKQGQVLGFFLGQPILFFDCQTQNLWIEFLSSPDKTIRHGLCDLAFRLSKEKHFQRVFFPKNIIREFSNSFSQISDWDRETNWLKTTK